MNSSKFGAAGVSSADRLNSERLAAAASKMQTAGLPKPVIDNFEQLFAAVLAGKTGVIPEEEIEPVESLDSLDGLQSDDSLHVRGLGLLDQLAVIRLNGGLGTSMGLARAKSLLPVKEGLSFNDIIARQLLHLRALTGISVPLLHMTSFSTDDDVQDAMSRYPELLLEGIPATFLQHKHPKIYADDLTPACEIDDELNWNPPGHGDIYAALLASGLAESLLKMGKRYLFVANADNLGATVDTRILAYLADRQAPFLMETALRTPADSKGGHLARVRGGSKYLLRESGQCPLMACGELIPEFRDVTRYRQFNTNNIWLDLRAVIATAEKHGGCLPLPLISNRKTVNPRDRESRKVIQIETAMGAAIGVFEGACALQVPRSRFAPVKTNNDLLLVRSDLYVLSEAGHMVVNPKRVEPNLPLVVLDPVYFGLIADFEARMKIVPSLVHARSLKVLGDVLFDRPFEVVGDVVLRDDAA